MILLSMKAPGSPSSPLQTTYLIGSDCFATCDHFLPVGKPPPPRPRKLESDIVSTTSLGDISNRDFCNALYPPIARYSLIEVASM